MRFRSLLLFAAVCLSAAVCPAQTKSRSTIVQGQQTVTFSATPVFDANKANAFKLVLTGNVTSSTLTHADPGQMVQLEICQDATGGRTFVAPTNVQGFLTIASAASACTTQEFVYDGSNAQPLTAAAIVAAISGVTFPVSPSTHSVPVITAANTATWKVVPDCTDSAGNHINYTQSTDAWSCGTSVKSLTPNLQKFIASGTFTIPASITAVKVTVVGAGGAGGGGNATNAGGGGGGAGGLAIKWLSGLTPGNTIAVTVGTGGTGVANATGNAGTASSIASGTQTITTVTGNGGAGGVGGNAGANSGGAGGTATNGDLNFAGNAGNLTWAVAPSVGALGGPGPFGAGPLQGAAASANTGSGGGGIFAAAVGSSGGSGIVIFEWVN